MSGFNLKAGSLASDLVADANPVKILYNDDKFCDFIRQVLGEPQLYRLADPLGDSAINVFKPGFSNAWHFDESVFTTTIMLQKTRNWRRIPNWLIWMYCTFSIFVFLCTLLSNPTWTGQPWGLQVDREDCWVGGRRTTGCNQTYGVWAWNAANLQGKPVSAQSHQMPWNQGQIGGCLVLFQETQHQEFRTGPKDVLG